MNIDEYMDQLEREMAARNAVIEQAQKSADELLLQAAQEKTRVPVEEPKKPFSASLAGSQRSQVTSSQAPQPQRQKSAAGQGDAIQSKEEAEYKQRIQRMARQLAETGTVDKAVLENMGPDAELEYLRARNQSLEKIVQQQNADLQKTIASQADQKAGIRVATEQRDRLQKSVQQLTQQVSQTTAQNDALKTQLEAAKTELAALQDKAQNAQRVAQNGISSVQGKEKQIARLLEQNQAYKQQLSEAAEREQRLRKQLEESGSKAAGELKGREKENEELQGIVRKQQQLIDVLQRQKLHLQGAIQLGFTEAEFNQILEK